MSMTRSIDAVKFTRDKKSFLFEPVDKRARSEEEIHLLRQLRPSAWPTSPLGRTWKRTDKTLKTKTSAIEAFLSPIQLNQ